MKKNPSIPDAIRRRLVTFTGDQDHYLFKAAKKLVSDERMTDVWLRLRKITESHILPKQKGEPKELSRSRLKAKDDFVDRDLEAYFDSVLCAYEDSLEATTEWGKMSQTERDQWEKELRGFERRLRTHLARGPIPMSKEISARALVPLIPVKREPLFEVPADMSTEDYWKSIFQSVSGKYRLQELKNPTDAKAQRKLFVLKLSDHLDNWFTAIPAAAITSPARVFFDDSTTDSWVRRTIKDRRLPNRAPALRRK